MGPPAIMITQASTSKSVLDVVKWLLQLGDSPSTSPWDNNKTYHLNLLLLVSTVASTIFALVYGYFGQMTMVYSAVSIIAFNILLVFLQAKQKPYIARLLTCFGYPLLFFLFIYLGKGELKGEYAFFLMVSISVLFFRSLWRQIGMIALVFAFFLTSQIILFQQFGAIENGLSILGNCIVFLSIAFALVLINNSFIRQIIDSSKKNAQLLKELAYSNEELKRLNFMVSHDLRTPLRQIVSFSKLAQSSNQQGETSSTTEYMELIEHSARELYSMTENLLSLAHLDQNQLKVETVELESLFCRLKQQFSKIEGSKTINIHTAAHDLQMSGSPILLQMVLQNLVENGIKYNESLTKEIWLEASEDEYETRIIVRDNGIGIPEDDQEKIFTVFHRLDHHKYQGTGLGLAIAKKIMDIHGGQIAVISGQQGSAFALRFPKVNTESESPEKKEQQQPIPLKMLYQISKQNRAIF